jgi:hypothetical protein
MLEARRGEMCCVAVASPSHFEFQTNQIREVLLPLVRLLRVLRLAGDPVLHLYKRISTSDVGRFERMLSLNEASLVIGTAPGEWVTEPHRLRGGSEIEGVRLEPGGHPQEWGGSRTNPGRVRIWPALRPSYTGSTMR